MQAMWPKNRHYSIYRMSQKNCTPTVSKNCAIVCANKTCFIRSECYTPSIAQAGNILDYY